MSGYTASEWQTFAFTLFGAAAALVGLIFVGISINLEEILRYPWLVSRAGDSIVLLVGVALAMGVLLVPGQPNWLLGLELVAIGLSGSLVFVTRFVPKRHSIDRQYRAAMDAQVASSSASVLLFTVAGITLWAGAGGGLYWTAPAALASVCLAILNAWVLLIEIKR